MRHATEIGVTIAAPLAPQSRVGTRVGGYELEDLLGQGGMGVVYRARHLHLDRLAALKLLNPELAGDAAFRERFLRESRTAATLHHPNIVTVYDAGDADGLLYIAMQLVEGSDLAELLDRTGALEPQRAITIAAQIADALDAAHAKGLVHRDVKPANVLIDDRRCYLTDFGLTRSVSSRTALTVHGEFVGTIDYVPPEQIEGRVVDGRADVYALGCLLYHMLAGAVPYARDSKISVMYAHMQESPPPVSAERSDLPASLDDVLARAMAKRPDDRYETCGGLVSAARAALGGEAPRDDRAVAEAPAVVQTMLVVAHEPSVAAMVRVALGNRRFRLVEADDPATVRQFVRTEPPAVALVDVELPTARAVLEALRPAREARRTATIAIASRTSAADGQAADADALVFKPFSALQLQHAVADLLGLESLAG